MVQSSRPENHNQTSKTVDRQEPWGLRLSRSTITQDLEAGTKVQQVEHISLQSGQEEPSRSGAAC